MKTLNLVYPDKSDIKYEILRFPDGQQDIKITSYNELNRFPDSIEIISRFNSFKDLELIICANAALRNIDLKVINLYIPYLLGARSDRKFVKGGTSYLRDVIAPIINSLGFSSVTVMDPHSDVTEALIDNIKVISNYSIVEFALEDIYGKEENNFIWVVPDTGALKKVYNCPQSSLAKDIIVCSKHRDIKTGEILYTEVPVNTKGLSKNKDFILVDDICDGGRTFIEIAKKIQPLIEGGIYLIVTHGIFSKGFEELQDYFSRIYCTNSYSDYGKHDLIKQLDIF